jgi:hypothetical protein
VEAGGLIGEAGKGIAGRDAFASTPRVEVPSISKTRRRLRMV